MHALVIDDSSAMRKLLKMHLAGCGFTSVEATDGEDALLKLREMDCPDLVLVDWNMPRMNGLQFVEVVRRDPAYSAARIMVVTSEGQVDHVLAAIGAGANEYIMKPFTPESFRDKLTILGFALPLDGVPA